MSVPRWFAGLVVALTGAMIGSGLVGVALALAGAWSPGPVLAAGVVVGLGGAALGAVVAPGAPDGRRLRSNLAAVVVVAMAAGFVAANWGVLAESPLLERDPGLYTATARWLARDGSLEVPVRVGPFADDADLEFVSVGMYDLDGDTLDFQGNHLTPALLAAGFDLAGPAGMQRAPLFGVAAGLLAVYALTVRATGRLWTGLLVVVAAGASLPVLSVARDALSEAFLLPLLWTALWLWTVAADRGRRAAAAAAGLCLGACLATRIDAAALLVPVPLALAAWRRRRPVADADADADADAVDDADADAPGLALPLLLGVVPGVAVAAADMALRSQGYLDDLRVEVSLSAGLLALGIAVALLVVTLGDRLPRLGTVGRDRAGAGVAAVVVGALLLAWFVRPEVQEATAGASRLIGSIQRAEGEPVESGRRYHELTMVWQAWYLGPALVGAAVVGAGVVVRRLFAGRDADRPLLLPFAVLGVGTVAYLARPAISPDQVWAMRRFVPAGVPLLCVLAALAVVAGLGLVRGRVARGFLVVEAALLALLPIGMRLAPVPAFREQAGFMALVDEACDVVDGDAVVVPENSTAGQALTQTLRSWCGVPVALLPDPDIDQVDELAAAWALEGRALWVLADSPAQLERFTDVGIVRRRIGPVEGERFLERTLTTPPSNYSAFRTSFFMARVGGG